MSSIIRYWLKLVCRNNVSYPNALYFVIDLAEDNVIGSSRRKITQDEGIVSTGIFHRRWKIDEDEISSRIRMINYQFRYDDAHFDGNAYIRSRFNPDKVRTNLSYDDENYDDEEDKNILPKLAVKYAFIYAH